MDPATITALTALFALVTEYGPWGLAGIAVFAVLRVWRSGEFLPKSFHDRIVEIKDERYAEVVDRYAASQDAVRAWRENTDKALKTAEAAQERQRQIMDTLAALREQLAGALQTSLDAQAAVRGDIRLVRDDLAQLSADLYAAREEVHAARGWGELGPNPNERPPSRNAPSPRRPGDARERERREGG